MEIHSQELHKVPGHGWKHYLFEFLMLFLAVFFGFLTENFRENIVNKEKEKHFIESIIADLKKDTTNLSLSVHMQTLLLKKMDNVLKIPVEKLKEASVQDTFYQNLVPFYAASWVFVQNNNTVTQLKNAGGFNVFSNLNAVDSINDVYYYYDSWIKINADFYIKSYEKTADLATQLIRLPESLYVFNDTTPIAVPFNAKKLIQYNSILFEQLYSNIRYQKGELIVCVTTEKEYLRKVERLLKLLRREYNL